MFFCIERIINGFCCRKTGSESFSKANDFTKRLVVLLQKCLLGYCKNWVVKFFYWLCGQRSLGALSYQHLKRGDKWDVSLAQEVRTFSLPGFLFHLSSRMAKEDFVFSRVRTKNKHMTQIKKIV